MGTETLGLGREGQESVAVGMDSGGPPEVECSGDSVRKLPTQILGPCLVHVKLQRMFVE